MEKKRIIVSVINDLTTDQRVARSCSVLFDLHYNVLLVGRKQQKSKPLEKRDYDCKRMKLYFEQGPQFYFFFNLRLFFVLLFTGADALFANDLDTLLPNYLVSRIKRIPLIYDSHEIFCEVPELQSNPLKKRIWEKLESWIVPNLKYCITVNQSIAEYFTNKYRVPFIFVRNIPDYKKIVALKSRTDLELPIGKKIVILQGAGINVQRGAEELVAAFQFLDESFFLLIVGSGDVIHVLKQDVLKLNLQNKVKFVDKVSAAELKHYTSNSNLGVTIDKDSNMNYHFSLPNKIFDYMHAGIPVLATRLPEIEKLVKAYHIGTFIENHEPAHIAQQIEGLLNSKEYLEYKINTVIAAIENNWHTEKQKLIKLINDHP